MTNEVTINDLLELEAYAEGLIEKTKALRLKLEGQQFTKNLRGTHEAQGIGQEFKAQVMAHKLKTMLENQSRPH